jgi:hypothetical protein
VGAISNGHLRALAEPVAPGGSKSIANCNQDGVRNTAALLGQASSGHPSLYSFEAVDS